MLYWDTTAEVEPRVRLPSAPSTWGSCPAMRPVTGMFSSFCRVSVSYSGVWAASAYCTPFLGLSQNTGLVWVVPAIEVATLLVTSFSVRPSWLIRVRSTSKRSSG